MVSVIMPSMNQKTFIATSVESVLSQKYSNLELIIIDGGSTDGTIEWLTMQQALDSRLRFFSEPDTGPANALNKAFRKTRGTIIGWLNSDDLYTSGAIDRAVQLLVINPSWLMVYGHAQHIDASGIVLDQYPTLRPDTLIEQFGTGCFICQPTVFFKRTMYVLLGQFDEKLKTSFDFDYWLRAFKCLHGRIGFVEALQAQSRLHDDCITSTQRRTIAIEGLLVLFRHLGIAPVHWVLTHLNEVLASQTQKSDALQLYMTNMLDELKLLIGEELCLPMERVIQERISECT